MRQCNRLDPSAGLAPAPIDSTHGAKLLGSNELRTVLARVRQEIEPADQTRKLVVERPTFLRARGLHLDPDGANLP